MSSQYSSSWSSSHQPYYGGYQQQQQQYYALIEDQANREAKALAQEYLKQRPYCEEKPAEENKEKVFIVYKFMQTPIEAITVAL
jgi:hypothetical protein